VISPITCIYVDDVTIVHACMLEELSPLASTVQGVIIHCFEFVTGRDLSAPRHVACNYFTPRKKAVAYFQIEATGHIDEPSHALCATELYLMIPYDCIVDCL